MTLGAVTLGVRVLVAGPVATAAGLSLAGAAQIFGSQLALRFFAGGGLREELGWRGFMLPRLQSRVAKARLDAKSAAFGTDGLLYFGVRAGVGCHDPVDS